MSDLTDKITLLRSLVHDGQERRLCDEIEGAVRILEDHPIARMQVGLQGVPGNTVEALEMWHCEARQLAHELRVLRITPGKDQPMTTRKENPEVETVDTGAGASPGLGGGALTREDAERICAAHGWSLHDWFGKSWRPAAVTVQQDGVPVYVDLPISILAALDPDRPPPLAALQRLAEGTFKMRCKREIHGDVDLEALVERDDAAILLARAWALGKEDGDGS